MKKIIFGLLFLAFTSANAQTADEIIQKYTTKMGGIDAFKKVKTVIMTGTLSVQGMDLPITIQMINGKAVRSDVEVMGSQVISAFKDGKGWKQNQFAGAPDPTDVSGTELADLKAQSMLATALMDYKARGSKVELQGTEDVGGVKTYKLLLTTNDGTKPTTIFINTNDYSIVKSISEREMMNQTANVETYFSELKEINGMKFYMSRVQKVDGTEIQSVKLDKIELDVPVSEKIFDKP